MREESLVAGDDDVGVGDETGEEWVGDAGVAVVVEEESGFVFVNIEAESAEAVVLKGFDGRRRINKAAPAGVDEKRGGFQAGERGRVDEVLRSGEQRTMERDDIGPGEEVVATDEFEAGGAGFRRRVGIERDDMAAEALENFPGDRADAARADESGGFAVKIKALKAFEAKIATAHAVVGEVGVAVEREQERDGVLGDGVRRIGGDVGDGEAQRRGGGEIDLVVARAAEGDQTNAGGGERGENGGVERIVDEGADRLAAAGEGGVGRGKSIFDPDKLMGACGVRGVEMTAVVRAGAVNGDFHAAILWQTGSEARLGLQKTRSISCGFLRKGLFF